MTVMEGSKTKEKAAKDRLIMWNMGFRSTFNVPLEIEVSWSWLLTGIVMLTSPKEIVLSRPLKIVSSAV